MGNQRINRFDNIKGVLIFLVVFGHFLEPLLSDGIAKALYVLIYSFHMPLFVFISGYFASFKVGKALRNILYPYIVFQILYFLFERFVLKSNIAPKFTTPYWIMWYLFALFAWTILSGLLKTKKITLCSVFIAVTVGILAGFCKEVGYPYSLSRILVFFPFFLLGYYLKGNSEPFSKKLKPILSVAVIFITILILIFYKYIDIRWLYGSYPYYGAYSPVIRLALYLTSSVWILFFLLNITNKKCFLTKVGQNSICVYLFHGFFVKAVTKFLPEGNIITALFMAIILTCILSLDAIKKGTQYLLAFPLKARKQSCNKSKYATDNNSQSCGD